MVNNNTVTRTDLVEVLNAEVGLPQNECAELLEGVLKMIANHLAEGEPIRVKNFGAFSCATRVNTWGATRRPAERS